MAEVNWYGIEEPLSRFDSHKDTLDTIRTLIAPNGEEDWFDDEGNWTEKGVAVAGTYIQDIEIDKESLAKTRDVLDTLDLPYEGNEEYYKSLDLGIDSEQDLYDKRTEYQKKELDYLKSISDSEQAVADMYESQIDAIEEYTSKLVESYNEYIDVVKEALDAERELYEFKKDIEKQTKDINELERRIASLSGSDNAADVAERRKLEAELYEAKEGLNDTYYSHAKDSQMTALEEEAIAYEESLNNYVEKLRTTLEEAQTNMDLFMESVTASVMLNAETVKNQYIQTGVTLDDALVSPWDAAMAKIKEFEGEDGLAKMNTWTTEEGFFGKFKTNATNQLKSPWSAGTNAAKAFKTDVSSAMKDVVDKVKSNVATAKTQLDNLYKQIQDTEKKASSIKVSSGSSSNSGETNKTETTVTNTQTNSLKKTGTLGQRIDVGSKSYLDSKTVTFNNKQYYQRNMTDRDGNSYTYYYPISDVKSSAGRGGTNYYFPVGTGVYKYYAKGTLGTKKDEYAITDEPWLGDELTMYATKQGTLSYMRAGSTVVPADLTKELIAIGEVGLDGLTNMPKFDSGVNLMSNVVNKPEFNLTFDNLLHIDNCTKEVLPEVQKLVETQLEKFTRQLNYSLKRVGAR